MSSIKIVTLLTGDANGRGKGTQSRKGRRKKRSGRGGSWLVRTIGVGTVLLLTILLSTRSYSQQDVTIGTHTGVTVYNVALPDYRVSAGDATLLDAARTIHQTIWDDLAFCGYFSIIPKEHYGFIPALDPKKIKFKDWASLEADLLVVGSVTRAGERLTYTGSLHDVKTQSFVLGKSYGGEMKVARQIGHQMANEIVKRVIGLDKNLFTSKIAFISDRDGNKELYVMDYDGSSQTRITTNKVPDMLPAWSADGRRILFTSYRNNNPDLFSYAIYEGQLIPVSTRGLNTCAAFSPDGSKIAFSSSKEGNTEIYIANPDGTQARRITNSQAIDTAPTWAPNGRLLAFTSDRGGSPQIYIMDAEGTEARRLQPQEGSYNDSAAWSPDGEYVLYVSREGGEFNIVKVGLTKMTLIHLTGGMRSNENPSWGSDGRHIVFASNRGGSYEIYVMDSEGGTIRQLTTAGNNTTPRWSR